MEKQLSEGEIKEALDDLSWQKLKTHLDAIEFDEALAGELLGHVRRCGRLVLKYPDPKREKLRDQLLDGLAAYLKERLGDDALSCFESVRATFRTIEDGYRGILTLLARAEVSKLLPDVRVAAYLQRANAQYKDVNKRAAAAIRQGETLEAMAGVLLKDDDGNDFSPDAASDAIVKTLTSTLLMEGYTNDWFDKNGLLVVPDFEPADEETIYKAGSTEVLGICWGRWERTEEHRRFLETAWTELTGEARPKGLPDNIQRVIDTGPTETWLWDFIANERLQDRLVQTFLEMSFETRMRQGLRGIAGPAPLLPDAYVSAEEAHSAVSLSAILGYAVVEDLARPGKLRLVEWLRGYAFLKGLAEERFDSSPAGVILIEEAELSARLQQVGLSAEATRIFLGHVSLGRTSRDMYDCPLVRTSSGKLILFAPAVLATHIVSVVLSNLSRLREQLSRKGAAFETSVRKFFTDREMDCRGFKVKREAEVYEFDAVLVWGDRVFLFECKNRSLSGRNPAQAYYFALENRSNARQLQRQADALRQYPDILTEEFGPEAANKEVVPCILNSLPFSLPGLQDGVYFTDWSAVTRFFQDRYVHAKTAHHVTDDVTLLHRSALYDLWLGDQPTPDRFIRALDNPFQLEIVGNRIDIHRSIFPVGPEMAVVSREFMRENTTAESIAETLGATPDRLRADIAKVGRAVKNVRARHKQSLLRREDRAWRERRKRRPDLGE